MSATTKDETVKVGIYNGKKFKVLFAGNTKHGDRAKLCWFSDEDKTFWVDLAKVEIVENKPKAKKSAPAPKASKAVVGHCATCTCQHHVLDSDQTPDEDPNAAYGAGEPTVEDMVAAEEVSLFNHSAPISKPIGHKVGKGSTICGCGAKKKPQYPACWDCHVTEKEDMGDYS